MSKLVDFLEDVSENRNDFLSAGDGKKCEALFSERLSKYFRDMTSSNDKNIIDFKEKIKEDVLNKECSNVLDNTLYKNNSDNESYKDFFISQPYGSQNYPDFIVVTEFKVFAVEIKYSAKEAAKPMWNSNLPKMDGIYIFGCKGLKQLTFFKGGDILSSEERKALIEIWDELEKKKKELVESFKEKVNNKKYENTFGFGPYLRKAYQQTQTFNDNAIINYFDNPNKSSLEKKAIDFVRKTDQAKKATSRASTAKKKK